MPAGFDASTFRFGEPVYLWLLVAPGMLLVLWMWQVLRRRADAGAAVRARVLPVRERYAPIGRNSNRLEKLSSEAGGISAALRAAGRSRGAAPWRGTMIVVKQARPPLVREPKGCTGGRSGLHRAAQRLTAVHREVRIRATETSQRGQPDAGVL